MYIHTFSLHHHIAVHLEFSLPFGETAYTASEQDEYLEVCIRVASTGSHEELLSPVEVNVTFKDQTTTGMYVIDLIIVSIIETRVG